LTLLLQHHGVNATFVDLTGWRDGEQPDLDARITGAFQALDLSRQLPIVTGYAQCREGLMREFDRGYSEVTFAAIASLLRAREAIIHKEFHLSSADPRLIGVDAVRKIGRTNYDVADQLSNMGMEAIHPKAAKRMRQAGVPLRVANAFEPQDPGTLIDVSCATQAKVEIVSGLPLVRLEVFEQDMVGVKGYDAAILDVLARHRIRIVSKVSNANTIVHHIEAPTAALKQAECDLAERFPAARISATPISLVSVIGRDLSGLQVMLRGLKVLYAAGIDPLSTQECGRAVDVQFVLRREDQQQAVRVLHDAFFGSSAASFGLSSAA
jgi:aspartate kinase